MKSIILHNYEYRIAEACSTVLAKICVAGIGNFGESLGALALAVEHASGINGGLVNSMR